MYRIPVGKFPIVLDAVLIVSFLIVFFFIERRLIGAAEGLPPAVHWVVMFVVGTALLAIPLFSIHDIYAARTMHCRIEPDKVVVKWGLYQREIRFEEIDEVSLTQLRGDYKIKLRTFGIGEPGYKIGWFKLAGYPKALLFVGNTSGPIVCIKSKGTPILLGVEKPEQFVKHIKDRIEL